MAIVLLAEGITKHYGGVYALKGARFAVAAGEVHALMGENGAGKSTLARIIAGSTVRDGGTISIDGAPVEIGHPLDAQRLGIGIIYQELDLFPSLSVRENMLIGNQRFTDDAIEELLAQVGLTCDTVAQAPLPDGRGSVSGVFVNRAHLPDWMRFKRSRDRQGAVLGRPVSSLPISQRQLLAIARALSRNARILLMDEPSSSLSGDASERLFALIGDLKRRGVAIVYVSHKMDEIFRLADRATVLRDGETIGTVEIAATSSEELIRMMVGREVKITARPQRAAGEAVLTVDGLSTRKLKAVSFELRRGEVLGIAGLVGSGRSELGAALYGLDRVTAGTVQARERVGLVPEDRRVQGLMMRMSVLENGTLGVLGPVSRYGFLDRKREAAELEGVARRVNLSCPSMEAPVSQLSGGNQQKVLLARWLLVRPGILFLDDPTRGIDVGAKEDVYRMIDELAAAGTAVILVSSELPELLRCSDRILVLRDGRVVARFDAGEATQEKIMREAVA
jgi:ABC-type sugar transport system ATPase subunit